MVFEIKFIYSGEGESFLMIQRSSRTFFISFDDFIHDLIAPLFILRYSVKENL